jgi:Na+-translocating ferredoxin:NAD+ oxidoreductase RnfG subunit
MKYQSWMLVPALVVPAIGPTSAFAVQYLTVEQAQGVLFPGAGTFVAAELKITGELKRQIEKASGVRVRNELLKVWRVEKAGRADGWFVVDEVIGKHEFITYAVALSGNGVVTGVEILDYRETHGGQVRNAKWRQQFVGKKDGDAFELDEDIRNISGATLSCKNITNGVKRIVATYQAALR